MMASPLRLLLLLSTLLFGVAWAQGQTPPQCALKCLVAAFTPETCLPINQTCICTNDYFKLNVTACVSTSCTIPEALVAQNVSLTTCGAPVRDRAPQYRTLSNVMVTVAAAFVLIRFVFKIFIADLDLGWDDYSVLATLIAAIPSAVITIYGTTANGLGKDIWTLPPAEITLVLEYFYIMAWLYFLQVALVKLALLFFYLRIFPSTGVQRLLWGTIIFTCTWGLCFILIAIFQCQPINYFWNKWDGMHEGKCLDINAVTSSHAGISIALDVWMLGIPMWQLRHLKMHWKKKIGVAMMFCVGTFVTVVSILRLQALVHFAASSNVTWEFYDVSMWSSIEICVGIMCTCMPTVRMLFVRFFPVLSGSAYRSRKYYQYGSGARLEDLDKSRTRTRVTGMGRGNEGLGRGKELSASETGASGSRADTPREQGVIVVQTSFQVQHSRSDTDEASLVSHDKGEKSPRGFHDDGSRRDVLRV